MEKFKTQEETYYLDNKTTVQREIVFIVIVRRYNAVSNKIEHTISIPLTSVICSVRIYAKVIIQEEYTLVTGFMKIW